MWQLSGLPCSHAIACIFKLGKYAEEYVPDWFRKDRYLVAYSEYIKPVDVYTSGLTLVTCVDINNV